MQWEFGRQKKLSTRLCEQAESISIAPTRNIQSTVTRVIAGLLVADRTSNRYHSIGRAADGMRGYLPSLRL